MSVVTNLAQIHPPTAEQGMSSEEIRPPADRKPLKRGMSTLAATMVNRRKRAGAFSKEYFFTLRQKEDRKGRAGLSYSFREWAEYLGNLGMTSVREFDGDVLEPTGPDWIFVVMPSGQIASGKLPPEVIEKKPNSYDILKKIIRDPNNPLLVDWFRWEITKSADTGKEVLLMYDHEGQDKKLPANRRIPAEFSSSSSSSREILGPVAVFHRNYLDC